MARGEWIRVNDMGEAWDAEEPTEAAQPLCLFESEKQYVLSVLKHCNGNIPQAAKILDISRSTLYRKLAEYGVRR